MTIAVFIVAEIRLFREALVETLERRPTIHVVGSAVGSAEALERIRELEPDVVLFDVRTPAATEAIRLLAATAPTLRIVALAVPETEPEIMRCAEAGIAGYVTEEEGLARLVEAIESVARGEALCSPRIAAALLRRVAASASERGRAPAAAVLTARELDVVALIDRGLSNKQIARELSIEVSTVKHHVHNLLEKLGAERRAEAAARLRPEGWPAVDLDPSRRTGGRI
jgi:DNA-binding NarL/FixJ family response regulator